MVMMFKPQNLLFAMNYLIMSVTFLLEQIIASIWVSIYWACIVVETVWCDRRAQTLHRLDVSSFVCFDTFVTSVKPDLSLPARAFCIRCWFRWGRIHGKSKLRVCCSSQLKGTHHPSEEATAGPSSLSPAQWYPNLLIACLLKKDL